MQRILRDDGHRLVDPRQPERLQALIHRYCPPSIGNIFAVARLGKTGSLEWWTELAGQPRRLDELPQSEQDVLKHRLAQRLTALGNLTAELERRGDPAAAELRELPTAAAPQTLYSVGGEPLLIRWVPTLSETAPEIPSGAAASPRPVPPARPRRRWLLPIGLPLLLGLVLLGLWLLFQHWDRLSLPWQKDQAPAAPLVTQEVDTGSTPEEPVLGTGDIQVTLRWEGGDDLDLAVTDPNGDTAYFMNPATPSGGQLDVDSNADCVSRLQRPVENIFWDVGNNPEGVYVASVSLYSHCSEAREPIPFELSISVNGNTETQTGTVNDPSARQVFEFPFP